MADTVAVKTIRFVAVSCAWLDYAHGPLAEDGARLSVELCAMVDCANGRSRVRIDASRGDLLVHLKDVAELYAVGPSDERDVRAVRLIQRIDDALASKSSAPWER